MKARRKQLVRKGRVSPMRPVPPEIARPEYAETGRPPKPRPPRPLDGDALARMRKACKAAAEVLAALAPMVKPGVTTEEIDARCHAEYIARGGYPSTLNYHGFPKSLCASVNEVVCHGIPDDRRLQGGDIVNLDITIYVHGMHGDTNATYPVGPIDQYSEKLIRVTHECLMLGIDAVKPGRPIADIGRAIEPYADQHGYSVVRRYGGHGIGADFHDGLHVPHHIEPQATTIMEPGMVFTIEPMLTMGHFHVDEWDDGWTVVTADGSRSAQFEHTILVTDQGAEILTLP
jgi:methionyl aminopeptidase